MISDEPRGTPVARPAFVSYDIRGNADRARVRQVLREYGDWIQQSLWVAVPVSAQRTEALARHCADELEPGDRLLIQRPCTRCLGDVQWLRR